MTDAKSDIPDLVPRVGACHTCRFRQGQTCLADGRPYWQHCRQGLCPRGNFPSSSTSGQTPATPRGLGDTLAAIFHALRLDKLKGKPCACQKRRDMLNRLIPYRTHPPAAAPQRNAAPATK